MPGSHLFGFEWADGLAAISVPGVKATACATCGKRMVLSEELAECIVYCDACPFPADPCEMCGIENPTSDHDCCDCEYCVARRVRSLSLIDDAHSTNLLEWFVFDLLVITRAVTWQNRVRRAW